jgi:predicted cupin superfamily sugar epimerase
MLTASQLIQQYNLQSHPEGGWYKETYRSNEFVPANALPERFAGNRVFSTAIYFLLEQGDFSAFHKIKSDECWHFYAGGALLIYVLEPGGYLKITQLGQNISAGQVFQFTVPANCWFASRPAEGSRFCFVGCTVAPGFDFADFEMADGNTLIALYPSNATTINGLCR